MKLERDENEMECPSCEGSGWDDANDDHCTVCESFGVVCLICRCGFPHCRCHQEEEE